LATAEPPTVVRPPETGAEVVAEAGEWTECLLEDRGVALGAAGSQAQPGWTITEGAEPGSAASAAAIADVMARVSAAGSRGEPRFAETWVFRTTHYGDFERLLKLRSFNPTGTSLSCRPRGIDAELRCADCVRLLRGGYYGSLGISVAAYPPQPSALGCLQLSKTLDMVAEPTSWGSPMSVGELGYEQRQTAFCNSMNARFVTAQ